MDRRFQKRIKRYLAERERITLDNIEKLDITGWFDLWHAHPDFKMKGNKARNMVAEVTYSLLNKMELLALKREEPIQLWATLRENTGDNAIYMHSKNPNGTPFPYAFEGVEWGVAEPPEAAGLIDNTHEIGKIEYEDEVVYFIRQRE